MIQGHPNSPPTPPDPKSRTHLWCERHHLGIGHVAWGGLSTLAFGHRMGALGSIAFPRIHSLGTYVPSYWSGSCSTRWPKRRLCPFRLVLYMGYGFTWIDQYLKEGMGQLSSLLMPGVLLMMLWNLVNIVGVRQFEDLSSATIAN